MEITPHVVISEVMFLKLRYIEHVITLVCICHLEVTCHFSFLEIFIFLIPYVCDWVFTLCACIIARYECMNIVWFNFIQSPIQSNFCPSIPLIPFCNIVYFQIMCLSHELIYTMLKNDQ